jgi:pyridoxamine 5'-phosphate oxidase
VRTLVFRSWAGPHQLDLLTDGRSAKAAELRREPRLELCWLLPKARCQFRLRGQRLQLGTEAAQAARAQHWQQLNPGARALWGWPPPGAAFTAAGPFPAELPDGTPLPEAFELLRIELEQVELLELTGHPHQRRRWRANQSWAEERLNP